jgi:branched-chain amino acid transport system substrate-binding protein
VNRIIRNKLIVLVLAFGLTILIGLPAVAADKILKVGLAMPFAGPLGAWGNAAANGLRMVAQGYNKKGGLDIGGQKHRIKFFEADSGFSPEGMAAAARRLIEKDGVDLIVGGMAAFTTLSLQEVTEPAKVPTVVLGYTKVSIDKSRGKSSYSFRCVVPYSEVVPAGLRWLSKAHPEIKKVALFEANLDSCWAGHRLFTEFAPEVGLSVVYNDYYEHGTTDFTPHLLKVLSKKPDLIYMMTGLAQDLAMVAKTARQLGYKGAIMCGSIPDMEAMAPIAGADNLEGLIGIGYAQEGKFAKAETVAWMKAFSKKYKDNATYAMWTAVPGSAIFQAIAAAGSLDKAKIKAVLEDGRTWQTATGIQGLWGNDQRYGHPHQWMADHAIWVVKNGKATTVAEIPIKDMYYSWKGKD